MFKILFIFCLLSQQFLICLDIKLHTDPLQWNHGEAQMINQRKYLWKRGALAVFLTLSETEFWSFPILWAESWVQSDSGFSKPRDVSIALLCLFFSPISQDHSTDCIFLLSLQPPVTRQLPADLSACTCYVWNSIFFCTSKIPAVLSFSPHGYKSQHSHLIQLTF